LNAAEKIKTMATTLVRQLGLSNALLNAAGTTTKHLKKGLFTALGAAVLFLIQPSTASACKYLGNATSCPEDYKEDGGEVECVAPVFKAKTPTYQSDNKKWQYGNYNCYWRGGDAIYDVP
jgi:hypothetical protein